MRKSLKGFDFGGTQTADIGVTEKTIDPYLKTIQNILMTFLAGSQVIDHYPLGYLFLPLG